jgi:type IV pilus assembly protein PilA
MTLIELVVVVLIIGILMAIAFPTYVGARDKSEDRGAQSVLRDSAVAARTVFSDHETFVGVTANELHAQEPGLAFVAGSAAATARTHEISVRTGGAGGGTYLLFVTGSASGRCFAVLNRGAEAARYQISSASTCAADDFDPAAGAWTDTW